MIIYRIRYSLRNVISKQQRPTTASKIAPIATASFLWNGVEQKDIAESGTGFPTKPKGFASIKM